MNSQSKRKTIKVSKKKSNRNTLIIGGIGILILAGIAYAVFSEGPSDTSPADEIKLPSYAYTNPLTLKAYRYAIERPDVLEQIPCYCGCGGHSDHRFLRDCFINDDLTFDDHASFCDICVGEAIKVQEYLAKGMTLKEARGKIDAEYSKYGDRTNTPPVSDYYTPILSPRGAGSSIETTSHVQTPSNDLSTLSLPDNFRSLSDGLKLIPPGISWAYFVNLKQGTGIEEQFIPDVNFYGLPIIGMLNSEYTESSWVELHDVGKSTVLVQSRAGDDVDHILSTRPYVFSTKDRTTRVLELFSSNNANAYESLKIILDAVDDENAGFAKITLDGPAFAEVSYIGLLNDGKGVKGEVAFRIKDGAAIPLEEYDNLKRSSIDRGFTSYDVRQAGNILMVDMTSSLNTIIAEVRQNYGIEF